MPNVRIAKSGAPLLPFCRPWTGRVSNPCFSTYADLVVFAAGVGYWQLRESAPPVCGAFLENSQPYPIDFSVFKNPNFYPLVLMLGLVASKSRQAVRDEERLSRLLESYSDIGFRFLVERLSATTSEEFHVEVAEVLADAAKVATG